MISDDSGLAAAAELLRDSGWGVISPEQYLKDMDEEFLNLWNHVRPYTLISPERGWAFAEAIRHVCRRNIPGDIVECGVYKGGACLLASHILASESDSGPRNIWLYDTFTGMVEPGDNDRIASNGQSLKDRHPEGWWAAGVDEVRKNLESSPLDKGRFRFVPGRVEETLLNEVPDKISVLRLDTDWFESTMMELNVLYPRLSAGGVLIIDDYGHFTGARKAVDDFFKNQGKPVLLHRSDYTGRVIVKD
ncbi:MAG: TylF/MycF/NovP-related O-methyltransferase [Spirochaetaceae bacterium]|nr:macrocin O-methyltransferase [Spirochaetaceae bacterium]MDT8298278.1 TylF/MycF/NovP-related O-methyltransferase [Spirochaetaceae bacterium]